MQVVDEATRRRDLLNMNMAWNSGWINPELNPRNETPKAPTYDWRGVARVVAPEERMQLMNDIVVHIERKLKGLANKEPPLYSSIVCLVDISNIIASTDARYTEHIQNLRDWNTMDPKAPPFMIGVLKINSMMWAINFQRDRLRELASIIHGAQIGSFICVLGLPMCRRAPLSSDCFDRRVLENGQRHCRLRKRVDPQRYAEYQNVENDLMVTDDWRLSNCEADDDLMRFIKARLREIFRTDNANNFVVVTDDQNLINASTPSQGFPRDDANDLLLRFQVHPIHSLDIVESVGRQSDNLGIYRIRFLDYRYFSEEDYQAFLNQSEMRGNGVATLREQVDDELLNFVAYIDLLRSEYT